MISAADAKKKLIEGNRKYLDEKGLEVVGAIYHIEDGSVEYLSDNQ